MKRLSMLALALVLSLFSLVTWFSPSAHADLNRNRLIDDSTFNDSGSMNAAQIDAFLNGFPNSCISTNSGFAAVLPTGYTPSGGFTYGGYATAGQVIATSAQVYGLNPKVLLVTLQKEQSLVTGGASFCENGDLNKYAAAVGYGCPDGGSVYSYSGISLYRRNGAVVSTVSHTCVNTAAKAGFSQQLIRGAWLLKFGQQRSLGNTGWAVITGSWDNSDDPPTCYSGPMTQGLRKRCSSDGSATFYDGYITIDGVATHMDSGATAALYWYTPHFHGNENFYNLYLSWFGDPNSPCANDTNVDGEASGPKIISYPYNGASRLSYTQLNNTGSTCAELHATGGNFQGWVAHVPTAMRAADPVNGTLVASRSAVDNRGALNWIVYSGAGGHAEIHRMSPDFKRYPGYYDIVTDLTGVTATSGQFVAGDFFGRGYDQLIYVVYNGAGGKVELHMFDPSMRRAIGYYDIVTDLSGITASTGTFIAGDFFGRASDQLAFVMYNTAGKAEIHMFNPTLTKAIGYYDIITDLTGVTATNSTFITGDFLGRRYSQLVYVIYEGTGGRVETHMFDPSLRRAIGFQDIITGIAGFDPTD